MRNIIKLKYHKIKLWWEYNWRFAICKMFFGILNVAPSAITAFITAIITIAVKNGEPVSQVFKRLIERLCRLL